MAKHEFTLILGGFSELSDEVEDRLFEAGCDDALLGVLDGAPFLDFTREAPSLERAVLSAIADVAKAGFEVVRIEPDDLVTAAEIARRAGRSRESIRQLRTAQRGPGGFPPPVAGIKGRTQVWYWSQVADWLSKQAGAKITPQVVTSAKTIATVNAAIDLKRHLGSTESAVELLKRVRAAKQAFRDTAAGTEPATMITKRFLDEPTGPNDPRIDLVAGDQRVRTSLPEMKTGFSSLCRSIRSTRSTASLS